jgi:hypothetical protein
MLDWLKRAFGLSEEDKLRRFLALGDALNAAMGGGAPATIERHLGTLKVRSAALVFGDPQYVPALELPGIDADEVAISARLWQYPSGGATVIALRIAIGDGSQCAPPRKIGRLAIDSAALVIADKADIDEHWTDMGPDRIGVIVTAPGETVLQELTRRFELRTVQVNPSLAEIVGPVTEELEREIEDYLQSVPKYSQFPFMYFRVQTNNSFDRAIHLEKPWAFIPVGNAELPLMFVCSTGRGDGCYDVHCRFSGDVPRIVTIDFIDEDGRA